MPETSALVSLHAFWFALIIPGFVFAASLIPILRGPLIWLTGTAVGIVYLAIFSFPDLQGGLSGGIPENVMQRILYRLVLTSDLPLVQVFLGSLFNLGLAVFVWKKPVARSDEKSRTKNT